MQMITNSVRTFVLAMGPLWIQIGTTIFGVVTISYGYLRTFLQSYAVNLPDISPLVFWIVLLCFISWRLLSHATKNQVALDPKVEFVVLPRPDRMQVGRGEKLSIRGKVTGMTGTSKCAAFIRSVRKYDEAASAYADNLVRSAIDLYWPDTKIGMMAKAETAVVIAPNKHHTFDIVEAHSTGGLRVPGSGDMQRWVQVLFDVPGKYEVEVCVTSAGISTMKRLEVHWSGNWDELAFHATDAFE